MTKPACRLGNQANCPTDSHGGDCCPHNVTGWRCLPRSTCSSTAGTPSGWEIQVCTVTAAGLAPEFASRAGKVKDHRLLMVRLSDATSHCGGSGTMIRAGGDGPRGFNELTVEDRAGQEEIYVHSEKDGNVHVKNAWKEYILHDKHRTVDRHTYVRTEGGNPRNSARRPQKRT